MCDYTHGMVWYGSVAAETYLILFANLDGNDNNVNRKHGH